MFYSIYLMIKTTSQKLFKKMNKFYDNSSNCDTYNIRIPINDIPRCPV